MRLNFLKSIIINHKELILKEILEIKGLMQMLMKYRNTGQKYTKSEKLEIVMHLKNIFICLRKGIPGLIIFSLPTIGFLLPFIAELLDRRKVRRV
jgi:hypothetical protein